jgi:hypothetical protein
MSIKKYYATKDNTISNAYREYSNTRRVSNLNYGLTDSLQIFSLYNTVTASTDDNEKSRAIVQFDLSQTSTDRSNGDIPASGSVSFYLKLKNYPETSTSPTSFTLVVAPISRDWNEGRGKSFDEEGTNLVGSNWLTASSFPAEVTWSTAGGDFRATPLFEQDFTVADEDILLDVTPYVESIITDGTVDYGLGIYLTSSQEAAAQSYYKKVFYSREYNDESYRPQLEARWNNSLQDDTDNFFLSSSRASSTDNLNTIYLYNQIRGNLKNIPAVGTSDILVSFYSGSSTTPSGSKLGLPVGGGVVTDGDTNATGSYVSPGIYSVSVAFNSSSLEYIYPVWHSGSVEYHTGSTIEPQARGTVGARRIKKYFLSITNLKEEYLQNQVSRLRLYVRDPSASPTIYTTAQSTLEATIISKAYYKIYRERDNFEIISYGTGSGNNEYTRLSYDSKGNYFDLDFSVFPKEEDYVIKFLFEEDGQYREQRQKFKFRVV